MSNAIYPAFDTQEEEELVNAPADFIGRALAHNFSDIENAAQRAGVKAFSLFFDNAGMMRYIVGDNTATSSHPDLPQNDWYSSAEGLTTVYGIIQQYNDAGETDDVTGELRQLSHLLTQAATKTVRFHLVWDF